MARKPAARFPQRGRKRERKTMAKLADLGVLGLSTMGANLARNAARKGFRWAGSSRLGARGESPVDDVIDELAPHLDKGDIIIDGGNSLFTDTNRRFHALEEKGL